MRVLLNGAGDAIPLEALPDPGQAEGDFVLELETGNFIPADFTALGFAYYEAWCIGGAGGRGGDPTPDVTFDSVQSQATMSSGDWDLWLELIRVENFIGTGEWDHLYTVSANYPNAGGALISLTAVQMEQRRNPGHKLPVTTYSNPKLWTSDGPSLGAGGSGGGGGLHVVIGDLADLPASVPVVVGAAGVDAGWGQIRTHGAWTPEHDPFPQLYGSQFSLTGLASGSPQRRYYELLNYFGPKRYKYPAPHPSFANPVVGGDGGASTFGGTLCRASGGKGGSPGRVWDHHDSSKAPGFQEIFSFNGAGGAGGLGNRTTAGGGAAGGNETTVDGSDGIWDGVVGSGGGGGRGGSSIAGFAEPFGPTTPDVRKPGNGGRGSYSFADTSVFGERQLKSKYPGGGGGSAHLGNHKFGSNALGYLPKGAVLLRLTKPA